MKRKVRSTSKWCARHSQYAHNCTECAAGEMKGPLTPSVSLLCKLGSIIVHTEEAASTDGHPYDLAALNGLLADPEVAQWLEGMRKAAFLPVKRSNPWLTRETNG